MTDIDVENTNAWDVYVTLAESADRDLTESWEKGIDVLLVYVSLRPTLNIFIIQVHWQAALFSSVLASFLSQSFVLTQSNPVDETNALLLEILQSIRNVSDININTTTSNPASSTALWINSLWFASLICALTASFFAMLARQWIQQYKHWMSSHPDDPQAKARLRHFRHLGIQRWRVGAVIWTLPFILHVSLLLFFAGLVLFAFRAHPVIGMVSALLVALTIVFYLITIALPFFFAQCPFQTPPIRPLQKLFLNGSHFILRLTVNLFSAMPALSKLRQYCQHRLTQHSLLAATGDKEAQIINSSKDALDAQVLATLISTSWDKSDKIIASALPSLPTVSPDARNVLRTVNAVRLIEKRYLGLLRLANEYPHLSIAPGCERDAYTYLRALFHLCEHDAVPRDWQPSNRLRQSLHSCKQSEDRNMRSVVLALIDRFEDSP
jgi:hypothetical protein